MKIAIVTDTNSGISPKEAEKEGIFLLPMPVIIDGESYLEGIDIQPEKLYEAMENECAISSSQPSPDSVMKLWDSVFAQGYDRIIHIPMSSGLSGSCQTSMMLAEEYDSRVLVADNHRISVTQRASVLEAKRMADSGKSAEEIKDYLESSALQASIYLTVESLSSLQKGGRLSPSAAMLGTILNIKPILSISGEQIDAFAKVRGLKKCEKKMLEAMQNDIQEKFSGIAPQKLHLYAAGTLRQPEAVELWKATVSSAFPDYAVEYFPLPCSIASHVGSDTFAIALCIMEY